MKVTATRRVGGLLRLYGNDLARLLRILDPCAIAFLFAWFNQHPPALAAPFNNLLIELFVLLLTALVLPQGNLYCSYRQLSLWLLAQRITFCWSLILLVLLLIGFASKTTASFSRLSLTSWALASWGMLIAIHVGGRLLLRWYRIRGGNTRTVLFWGAPHQAIDFYDQLKAFPYIGLRFVAWFYSHGVDHSSLPLGMPYCSGGLDAMERWLREHEVDQIFFADSQNPEISTDCLIRFFGDTCLPVFFLPAWSQPSMSLQVRQIGFARAISLWGREKSSLDREIKRLFDLLAGSAALIVLSPLIVVIALAIALTSNGPVFFLQDRYGFDGNCFRIIKFRTMYVTEPGSTPGLKQAQRNDPRITPVGRFLRRWSLDEIPQLVNVLKGDMSLVGPRPHAVDHNEQYRRLIPGYMQRHVFKPGMTGLAQVEGWRGETATVEAMRRRIDADLRYQRDWSIALDLSILLRTVAKLRSPAAY